MIPRSAVFAVLATLATLAVAAPAGAAEEPCPYTGAARAQCFGLQSLSASLSTSQAGAHPDVTFGFAVKTDPETAANSFGMHDAYAPTRNVRVELPPGLIGDPNALGAIQQCSSAELAAGSSGGGCPNGSQIGRAQLFAYTLNAVALVPVYMMQPPGGEVAARIAIGSGIAPVLADLKLRSESDYGLTAEIINAPTGLILLSSIATIWGVPGASSHDRERCTLEEVVLDACTESEPRPPGGRKLPFLTNPTRCNVPLEMRVGVSSWVEPDRFDTQSVAFPEITGCNKLPFGPDLTVEPTSTKAAAPAGADVTIRLPASEGVEVLEPAQIRSMRVELPEGFAFNPAAGDGLETCSAAQVGLGTRNPSACPDAAKLADTEFEIPVLERSLKGAVYLREPEPGNPFRIWITADELGLHVKLPGQLDVDKVTGQIDSIVTDVPQAPLREARIRFKSGFRAPLVLPSTCGTYRTEYEFTPWSGGPPLKSSTPMEINTGCDTGGFSPKLSAGTVNPAAGQHSPFVFTLRREDGEQNPAALEIALPRGMAATFRGVARCDGIAAETGACPEASRIGRVSASAGAGPAPLWIPQPGKRPTAVYLGGPYKGGPLSVIAVVPAQAGPFDFGDEVVRSAVYVDPVTAQARIVSDPFPQQIEGIPIGYRTLHVAVDRENFTLNPTGCAQKTIAATVTSATGAVATPSAPFAAANCASLGFKPKISLNLKGGTKRGDFPAFRAEIRSRPGDANIASTVVRLPRSVFLEQGHFQTICTRVQFAQDACPAGATYGWVRAFTPLLDEPLEGPVILRSSNHNLPDMVFDLHGLIDVEASGRIDSVKGGVRSTFAAIPDAPISKVILTMQGGKKGLIVNSRDLCKGKYRANIELEAHNGRKATLKPLMKPQCKGKKRKGAKKKNAKG